MLSGFQTINVFENFIISQYFNKYLSFLYNIIALTYKSQYYCIEQHLKKKLKEEQTDFLLLFPKTIKSQSRWNHPFQALFANFQA